MKTFEHVQTVLRCELDQWFRRQAANPSERYYLYYLPSSPKYNSGLLIAKDKPVNSEYKLTRVEHISGFKTISTHMNELAQVLRHLPILDNKE